MDELLEKEFERLEEGLEMNIHMDSISEKSNTKLKNVQTRWNKWILIQQISHPPTHRQTVCVKKRRRKSTRQQ